MIRGVLFDMDGVLFDSEQYYAKGTYIQLQEYGFKGRLEDIYPIIGTTMEVTYDILYDLLDGKVDRETIIHNNEEYFNNKHPLIYSEVLYPDVKNTLKILKEMRIKIALCTISNRETVMRGLKETELLPYFDVIITEDDATALKPDPEVYLKAMEHLKLTNSECLVVEDSTNGIQAGKNANIVTAARYDSHFGMNQDKADWKFNDLQEVVNWIEKENATCQKL